MFSIVIPLYNKQNYIKRCLDSILAQSFIDYDIVVVDDGSTDDSLNLVKSYDDRRINIITQSNQGVSAARNRGIKASSGSWVAFIDADDAWTVGHLAELSVLIQKFDNAGIVSTRSMEVKSAQADLILLKKDNLSKEEVYWKRQLVDYFRIAALTSGLVHSSSVAIKREVFDKVGYFKCAQQGEDTEFWARVCLSFPCAISNKPTSFYYRGTGGVMEQQWLLNVQKQGRINSIKDIGFAVSFLADEIDSIPVALKDSVIFFINNSITRSLKISFYNGQIASMPFIGSLLVGKLNTRFYIWRFFSEQPQWLLLALYGVRSTLRNIYKKSAKTCF